MLNLFKADIYRILRGKALYITLAVLVLIIVLMVAASFQMHMGFTPPEYVYDEYGVAQPHELTQVSAASGVNIPYALADSMENFVFFLLPIIVIVAGAIFTHGTVKNDLAWGISRTKLYFSKLLLTFAIGTMMLLFYVGLSIVLVTINNGFGGPAPAGHWVGLIQIYLAQLVLLFALMSIGVFLAFVTKRTAAVNGAFIGFCMVPPFIIMLLTLSNEWFLRLFDFDMLSNIMALSSLPQLATGEILRALGVGVFWLILSTVSGIALFRRAEIK